MAYEGSKAEEAAESAAEAKKEGDAPKGKSLTSALARAKNKARFMALSKGAAGK